MTSRIKRALCIIAASACMLSAATITASASTNEEYDDLSNGYRVGSRVEQTSSYVKGEGVVINGGPCDIEFTIYAFHMVNNNPRLKIDVSASDYTTSIGRKISGGSYCGGAVVSRFNNELSIWATTGTYNVYEW